MNIHLPAILMWTTGVQGFDPLPYMFQRIWTCLQSPTISYFLFYFVSLLQPQQIELTECIAKSWLRKWEKSCWRLKLHGSPQASLCTQSMTSLTYNHIYIFYHIFIYSSRSLLHEALPTTSVLRFPCHAGTWAQNLVNWYVLESVEGLTLLCSKSVFFGLHLDLVLELVDLFINLPSQGKSVSSMFFLMSRQGLSMSFLCASGRF